MKQCRSRQRSQKQHEIQGMEPFPTIQTKGSFRTASGLRSSERVAQSITELTHHRGRLRSQLGLGRRWNRCRWDIRLRGWFDWRRRFRRPGFRRVDPLGNRLFVVGLAGRGGLLTNSLRRDRRHATTGQCDGQSKRRSGKGVFGKVGHRSAHNRSTLSVIGQQLRGPSKSCLGWNAWE